MKKHYICTGGCRGVSEHPGTCQAPDCEKHKHELVECFCTDGKHNDFKPVEERPTKIPQEDKFDLEKEVSALRTEIQRLTNRYGAAQLFLGGVLRGAGIIAGATLLVLVGSALLSLLGLLPGLEDVVRVIIDAFDKARVQ